MREFVEELARWEKLEGAVVHRDYVPPREARFGEPATPLPGQVREVLDRLGIPRLYTHQAEAIDRIREGRDVAVVTPTASGKSLVFYVPTIEAVLGEPGARSLYIFPYKALEQDQLQNLRRLGRRLFSSMDLSSDIYDGDTPASRRRAIKGHPPDVLITNPDMLHLGILAYHGDWKPFLERLRIVVVDELHVYRGIFGSHLAHVLRRLWRVCAHYGSRPRLIACSATVGNPAEFASALTAREVQVVSESGAPHAGKHFLFLNPEGSPYTAATNVLARAVESGHRTIAFTKARKITELIHAWLIQSHPHLKGKVSSYRAGYLPEERREIESRLFSGQLWGVVSTSALELGIDVGELDVCILVGYPGSVMSSWQRIGRVGRQERESLTVLVGLPDALDQYFMKRPRQFFERPFERAVLDPCNPGIAAAHLVCAGAEVPFHGPESDLYPGAGPIIEGLVSSGRLVRDAAGERLFSLKRRPQREISLRSAGTSYAIVDAAAGRTIGSIDGVRVFHECHEGAIYLHAGTQYEVLRLDTDKHRVEAVPCDVDYYTQATGDKETEILETFSVTDHGAFSLGMGRLKVTVRLSGYEKRRIFGQDILSRHPMTCPPIVFETVGFWIVIPESLEREAALRQRHFMGGLHATEHSMISMFPLLALCDRNDVGGISYTLNAQLSSPAIFIYDGYPGGIGLAARVHDDIHELIARTRELLDGCPCEDGCPSCIQSPKCGSGNRPLDKEAARLTLAMLAGKPLPPTEGAEERAGRASGKEVSGPAAGAPAAGGLAGAGRPGALVGASGNGRSEVTRPAPVPGGGSTPPEPGRPAGSGPAPAVSRLPADLAPLIRPEDGRLLFFDVETQRSAEEVGGWGNIAAMGLGLAVVHEPARGEFRTYTERDVDKLLLDLMAADTVVGYNIDRFDVLVLAPYTSVDLGRIRTVDMLARIHALLGFRVSLGHLAEVNLGEGKSADGLQSIQWFREGRLDLVEAYCRKDVEITARLFFLGRRRGYLLYKDSEGRLMRVPVNW